MSSKTSCRGTATLVVVSGLMAGPSLAQSLPAIPAPQPQEALPRMIEFIWSAGPPLPRGMQDNGGGIIDNHLIVACGFCLAGPILRPSPRVRVEGED